MSNSNCYFLTCIQISQEAGQVVWYCHLLKNFPQFVVIHTVKGFWFGVVNKANVDVFLESSCFFYDPKDVGNLISGSSAFPKSTLNTKKFSHQAFHTKKYLIMSNNTLNTGKEAKLKQKIQEDIKRLNW